MVEVCRGGRIGVEGIEGFHVLGSFGAGAGGLVRHYTFTQWSLTKNWERRDILVKW